MWFLLKLWFVNFLSLAHLPKVLVRNRSAHFFAWTVPSVTFSSYGDGDVILSSEPKCGRWSKETKEDLNNGKPSHTQRLKGFLSLTWQDSSNPSKDSVPSLNSNCIFNFSPQNGHIDPKIHMEMQGTQNSKTERNWRIHTSQFQTYFKGAVIKMVPPGIRLAYRSVEWNRKSRSKLIHPWPTDF